MKRWAAVLACLLLLVGAGSVLGREPGRGRGKDVDANARLIQARAKIAAAKAEEARISRQYAVAAAARDAAAARLSQLLAALWPMRIDALAGGSSGAADWAEADRRYIWARSLYDAARAAQAAQATGAAKAEASRAARDEAAGRLGQSRGEADAAFSEVLSRRMDELELERGTEQTDPAGVLGRALGETDPGQPAETFALPPGGLSRPVGGRLAAAFAPAARPPRHGVVLAAPEGSPVVAAADGRVVYSGVLRGLGRVVIVSHDGALHTVYACLASAEATVGDTVTREGLLGRSGLCGLSKEPGVYFELRFREKALNPAEWFAARR
jgi:murein DD-endopeptidase MepM/ murein hydrolase activator NlpD